MAEEYNRGLFHKWVPGLGNLVLILILLLTYLLTYPLGMGNIGQMVGSTGIMSEYFMWANFAGTIGMGMVLPFIMRLKTRFRSKEIMIASLVVMALMSVVIATTSSGPVIVGASFIFGIFKMMGMVEVILPVMFILSPKGDKNRFYALFYPIAMIAGQVSVFISSMVSLDVGWQGVNFWTAGTFLLVALICVIFMHNQRFAKKMPLYYLDWPGVLLFATALLSLAYILSFGKQQDWFTSSRIIFATVLTATSTALLIIRELRTKHPFLSFKLYRRRNVLMGLILLVGQGMYMGTSSIMSIYTQGVLGLNWMTNASLNLMMIPGMLIAGFVAFHWTKNKLPIRMLVFSGFAAYFLYTVMMYFIMVPGLSIEMLYLPQILGGYGMCSLFISLWIYTLGGIPQKEMIASVAPVMVFRSFMMMALFTSLFGWLQYRFQLQSVGNLAFYYDVQAMSFNPAIASGAVRDVQLGAVLASNKKLLGYIIIAGIGFLTFIFFHQFGQQKYRLARYKASRKKMLPDKHMGVYIAEVDESTL